MKLRGVLPALVTPFDQNGNINFKVFEKHMGHSGHTLSSRHKSAPRKIEYFPI